MSNNNDLETAIELYKFEPVQDTETENSRRRTQVRCRSACGDSKQNERIINRIQARNSSDDIAEKCIIAQGKFSTVIKAKHKLVETIVAMKISPTNSMLNGKLRLQLAHNEAIKVTQMFRTQQRRHINLTSELNKNFRNVRDYFAAF